MRNFLVKIIIENIPETSHHERNFYCVIFSLFCKNLVFISTSSHHGIQLISGSMSDPSVRGTADKKVGSRYD
jgi:hypothetical protein